MKNLWIILTTIVFIIGLYLLMTHKAHLLGIMSYFTFPLFILVHILMHAGHSGHGKYTKHKEQH